MLAGPQLKESIMRDNVGGIDLAARIAVGALLLGLGLVLKDNARWLILPGGLLLGMALARWCPLYALFGVSTCKAGAR